MDPVPSDGTPEPESATFPNELSSGRYESFVVRVFTRAGAVVEGQVTHVASRRSARFTTLERALSLMVAYLTSHRDRDTHGLDGWNQK